jgi:carbamoyltransferase
LNILGISAYYHDSAAALTRDGVLVAAAQEERFSRQKHDFRFPAEAVRFCLDFAGLELSRLDAVVFYDKPLLKFERLLETYLAFAPRGLRSFVTAMPIWLKEKLYLKSLLKSELSELSGLKTRDLPRLLFTEHHEAHAASAFFASPFPESAVLCLDGVGEWATVSAWKGEGAGLIPLWQLDFPHSLGLLYSAFTSFCGFRVNSGEYKLMGLAPYGSPVYRDRILEHLLDLKPDGTFRLDLDYFDFCTGLKMTSARFDVLFDGPAREPESEITRREQDLAASVQAVTEEIVLRLANTVHHETGASSLCLAGGVALNCVANGRIVREGPFREVWIQPAAGDAGGAVGAALAAHYGYFEQPRKAARPDSMAGCRLGPAFSDGAVQAALDRFSAVYHRAGDDELADKAAGLLDEGLVIGWFQGRMEFGPRALGCRSILGDPRDPDMQRRMNLKIKFRESFRPFAPAVLEEHSKDWFDLDRASPYMLIVSPVCQSRRRDAVPGQAGLEAQRSEVPAVTHVDYSARVQTVGASAEPRFRALLDAFEHRTGVPMLINTSFNVRGEPIVCTPEDAYRCFMRTDMDALVIGRFVLLKQSQPAWREDPGWRKELRPD